MKDGDLFCKQNNGFISKAVELNLLHAVKASINAGADIHAEDDVVLRWASSRGYFEIVKVLLDAGADVHVMDAWSLHWASKEGHIKVVKLLEQAKSKL